MPADWQPLSASNPVPGDDEEVSAAGTHYTGVADEIQRQVTALKNIGAAEGMSGNFVPTLKDAADGLHGDLAKTEGRYREVGGKLTEWSGTLKGYQEEAVRLHAAAVEAQGDVRENTAQPSAHAADYEPTDAENAAERARQGRYDTASGDLSSIRGSQLEDLRERRDDAAGKVADYIRDKSDDDVADSWWDNFKDWMDEHAEFIDGICKIMGVIAIVALVVCLVVPGLNIVAAGALVTAATWVGAGATVVSLAGHTMLATTGNGNWLDVGLDVFTIATLGMGRVFAPALRAASRSTRAAGAVEAGNAARRPAVAAARREAEQIAARANPGARTAAGRSARQDIRAAREAGQRESNAVYESTRATYAASGGTATRGQVALRGAGDAGMGADAAVIRNVTREFPNSARVAQAAQGSTVPYRILYSSTAGANTINTGRSKEDYFPSDWYTDFKNRFETEPIGSTW